MELSAPCIQPSLRSLITGPSLVQRLVAFFRLHVCATFSISSTWRDSTNCSMDQNNLLSNMVIESEFTPLPGRVQMIPAQSNALASLQSHWPLLAHLTGQRKWVVCVAPPMVIPSPLLIQEGVHEARFMAVNARSVEGRSWALLQALQGKHCGAILYWGALSESAQRQLESLVQESGVYCLWFKNE